MGIGFQLDEPDHSTSAIPKYPSFVDQKSAKSAMQREEEMKARKQ